MEHTVDQVGPFAYRDVGTGAPVLFLHGLGGSSVAWEPQLEALAGDHRCIAWDMPGYGGSEPIEPLTFHALADAAARLLDSLDVERVDVVGLSFGGQQALHLALRHPARVRRLVLADTSASFGADGTDVDEWIARRLLPLDQGRSIVDVADQVIDAVSAPGFAGRERDRTLQAFGRIPVSGFRAAVRCLPTHDVRSRLGHVTAPTLVIVGELDRETPVEYARTLATGIPNADLAIIPGVGHLTPAEAPDEFNALVARFLAG